MNTSDSQNSQACPEGKFVRATSRDVGVTQATAEGVESVWGRDIAANSAKPRINTSDSQDSQPYPEGKCRQLAERQNREIRNIRKAFATAGIRINTSDSQDSQHSQGVSGGNAFSAIVAHLAGVQGLTLKPYPAHQVRRHALGG